MIPIFILCSLILVPVLYDIELGVYGFAFRHENLGIEKKNRQIQAI